MYSKLVSKVVENFHDKKAGKNRKIFLVFLLFSTILWFLNALDGEYIAEISYPVEFTNFPEDKVLTSEKIESINLQISAYGYDILSLKTKFSLNPLKIDIGRNNLEYNSQDTSSMYLLMNTYMSSINKQVSQKIKVLNIFPDSVFFSFSGQITKKIPVNNNLNISCKSMYMLAGKPQITPDSIEITGLSEIISKIEFIDIQENNFKDIDASIDKKFLIKKNPKLKYDTEKIRIQIPVERYTEKEMPIQIKIVNLPDSLNIMIFPETVKVTFKIPLSEYENIKKENFSIVADYKEIENGMKDKLTLISNKYPQNIDFLRLNPKKIDYIIGKN